ncbi:hypothetical protein L1049_027533 [Liquidambar formosana]|uniref:Replication protein A 70 kDa DNA-binding subunit B/D first OB fold domain-containing protein n=1 Tax=Liquidambar formosana TaxID=63359 RepID=A0AAP0WV58_LIQFO
MNQKEMYIKVINPTTLRGWKVRVKVEEKHNIKSFKQSPTKLQSLILTDSKGSQTQASIWGKDIGRLDNRLKENKEYYISNAIIKAIPPQYQYLGHPYDWRISASTVIEECPMDDQNTITTTYEFTPFSDFSKYLGKGIAISKNDKLYILN